VPRWRAWSIYFQHAASKPAMLALEQPSYYSESRPRLASVAAVYRPRKSICRSNVKVSG